MEIFYSCNRAIHTCYVRLYTSDHSINYNYIYVDLNKHLFMVGPDKLYSYSYSLFHNTVASLCEEDSVRLSVDESQDLYLKPSSYPSYYFVKNKLHRGRVEVCDSSRGYRPLIVCDDSWREDSIATVTCRELGFSSYGMTNAAASLLM